MKKLLVLLIPMLFLVFMGCSQEKAVERMMQNEEIATMVMTKMMGSQQMRADVMQNMMQNPEAREELFNAMLSDTTMAMMMADRMMANDWAKEMLTKKVDEAKKKKR
ncbi:MAG: hypothetical protein OEV55_02620 [candidate division Zixibacteria bacterium]|nr:hypothetical protein [candidate division Zixibacteria bacterium]